MILLKILSIDFFEKMLHVHFTSYCNLSANNTTSVAVSCMRRTYRCPRVPSVMLPRSAFPAPAPPTFTVALLRQSSLPLVAVLSVRRAYQCPPVHVGGSPWMRCPRPRASHKYRCVVKAVVPASGCSVLGALSLSTSACPRR